MMKRFLLIMTLLCVTMAALAKREKIDLVDQSRSITPPIEVYIDNHMLEFEVSEDLETLDILIEDVSGNSIFSSIIDGNSSVIPLGLKKGSYILIITYKDHILWGDFCVE